jgi:cytidylate kinase
MIITIDGPTGSGKSSTARILANKMGIYYLNSGALYRAIAHLLTEHAGYSLHDLANPKIEDILGYLAPQRFAYTYTPEESERIFLDNNDITPFLKQNPAIDQAASIVSTNQQVRNRINELCREIAQKHFIVTDGRDMGSVVFPDAAVKFYLNASLDVRTQRWLQEQEKRDNSLSFEEAKKEVAQRDERDLKRPISPLVVPQNAIVIDNSEKSLMETVDELRGHITY